MTKSRLTPDEGQRSAPLPQPSDAVAAEPDAADAALQSVASAAVGAGPVQVIRRWRRGRWTLTEVYG